MKILFFSEQSPYTGARVGGAENSMRLIAEGLAARGHHVSFASLRGDPVPLGRRFRQSGVDVRLLADMRRSRVQRGLRKAGLEGAARAHARAGWTRAGRVLFGAERFDLLYAFYELDFLEQALAARGRGAGAEKIVMRMAGLGWHDTLTADPTGAAGARMARLFPAVDAVNYLSERSRALIEPRAREAGIALERPAAFIADIGVDVGGVPRMWQGPRKGAGLDIVTATRFSASQKRQDILVEALGRLKGKNITATLIGDGPMRERVAARVAALGLAAQVEIVPFMDQKALWARLARADLLCHPCDHEGVSKIILEAMMLGLPVLASDVEPLPDYVIAGQTGLRVANTAQDWAEALEGLARDKSALPGLSESARDFVARHYDRAVNIARYETAFADLIEGKAPLAEDARPGP